MPATQRNINELLNSLSRQGVGANANANAQQMQSSLSALGRRAEQAAFSLGFFPTANHNGPSESNEQSWRPSLSGA